jgi:hypothetical protein
MPTPKLSDAEIARSVKAFEDSGKNMTEAAALLGVTRSTLSKRLDRAGKNGATLAPKKVGRSIDEFRATHDKDFIVPQRIRDGLAALGDGWEYEVAFSKLAGVNLADLGNYRSQFDDHIITIRRDGGKRAWAGTKASAAKMREMVS